MQCPGQIMAITTAETYIVMLIQYLDSRGARLRLASEAQPEASRIPTWWKTNGDGRARGGREQIWPINDVTLTVKVSLKFVCR
jgi:hypothetical protein